MIQQITTIPAQTNTHQPDPTRILYSGKRKNPTVSSFSKGSTLQKRERIGHRSIKLANTYTPSDRLREERTKQRRRSWVEATVRSTLHPSDTAVRSLDGQNGSLLASGELGPHYGPLFQTVREEYKRWRRRQTMVPIPSNPSTNWRWEGHGKDEKVTDRPTPVKRGPQYEFVDFFNYFISSFGVLVLLMSLYRETESSSLGRGIFLCKNRSKKNPSSLY